MKKSIKALFSCIMLIIAAVIFSDVSQSSVYSMGIIQSNDGFNVQSAYNLNLGDAEISLFSYRLINNEKLFESFGKGYGGYYTTGNRWKEAPLLLEKASNMTDSDYIFGDKFSGSFSIVARGIQSLYSHDGTHSRDYSTLMFSFYDGDNTLKVKLTQNIGNDYLTISSDYNGMEVKNGITEVNASLAGRSNGKDYPLYLAFDGESGVVTVRNDDGRNTDNIVCDLSEFGYTQMNYYTVSVGFYDNVSSITYEGKNYNARGRLLIYELCGQNVSGNAPNTKGAMLTCFDNLKEIYKGAHYLPKNAFAYDILDGDISSKVVVSVQDFEGKDIPLVDGRFYAQEEGDYFIQYRVLDSGGLESIKSYQIKVSATLPAITCTLARDYQDVCGLDERIYISKAEIKAKVTGGTQVYDYNVVVMKDGVAISIFSGDESGYFIASETGVYKILYVVENGLGLMTSLGYSVECKNIPGFIIPNIPTELSYNVEYDFGDYYAMMDGDILQPRLEIAAPDNETFEVVNGKFIPDKLGDYKIRFYLEGDHANNQRIYNIRSKLTSEDLIVLVNEFDQKTENVSANVYEYSINGVTVTKTLKEKSGVLISGKGSDQVFRYNNPIDFNNLSALTPVVNFSVLAGGINASLNEIEIRLVDADDSSNYVKIHYSQHSTIDYYCYVRAGANGKLFGRSNEANRYENIWTSTFGTVALNSLSGTKSSNGAHTFNLYFDYNTKIISIANANNWQYGEFFPVVDLDDGDVVGDINIWNGFKNGKAYLEIKIPGSVSKVANILVYDVAGQSIGGNSISELDLSAPVITVDSEYATDAMPKALREKSYKIPKAVANDFISGKTAVSTKVYDPDGKEISIVNNEVTPQKIGVYKIKYEAVDIFGNRAETIYEFECVAELEKISIEWMSSVEEYVAGSKIYVPEIKVSGGSGNIKNAAIEILYNGKEITLPKSRLLTLSEAGTITFKLKSAEDYIGSAIKNESLSLNIMPPEKVTLEVGGMPEKYVVGSIAYVPDVKAFNYNYKPGEVGHQADVSIYINGTLVSGATFTVADTEFVEIMIIAGSGQSMTTQIFNIPTVKPQQLSDYFVVDQGAFSHRLTNDGLEFTMSGGTQLSFINPVVADQLQLRLNMEAATMPSGFCVILQDYNNPNESINLRITPLSETQSQLEFNGSGVYHKVLGNFTNLNQYYGFMLSNNGTFLDVRSSALFKIDKYSNGEDFNGFSSGLVKISFILETTKSQAAFLVNRIGNQIFDMYSYDDGDSTAPSILFETPMMTTEIKKGDVIVVSSAKAYDVLNMYGTVTLRVTAPNENGVIEVLYNNIIPNQTLEITALNYGTYSAIYTTKDEFNNSEVFTYRFTVVDREAPVLTIGEKIKTEYSAGDTLQLPEINMYDNYDNSPKLVVMVYNSATRYNIVSLKDGYVLSKDDKRVVIYAYDANYNIVEYEYEIIVR